MLQDALILAANCLACSRLHEAQGREGSRNEDRHKRAHRRHGGYNSTGQGCPNGGRGWPHAVRPSLMRLHASLRIDTIPLAAPQPSNPQTASGEEHSPTDEAEPGRRRRRVLSVWGGLCGAMGSTGSTWWRRCPVRQSEQNGAAASEDVWKHGASGQCACVLASPQHHSVVVVVGRAVTGWPFNASSAARSESTAQDGTTTTTSATTCIPLCNTDKPDPRRFSSDQSR
ncbi:hypothetical protein P280DRAFT_505171 [Massarina eburnea CBS 473.64]|uniref:Uncharacterized protein n=1 Tax=Massarina eburnea CBS 473.64 TaxID=1395130 RepID=A0A6A6S9H9_9PLEO|nr:hypothetical protein P280DRAFT_505171 [Massarina eburnea CBS 473.64]